MKVTKTKKNMSKTVLVISSGFIAETSAQHRLPISIIQIDIILENISKLPGIDDVHL